MSKRKQKKLASIRKRLKLLELRITLDTQQRDQLAREATFLSAQIAVEAMPAWKQNILIHSGMATNPTPRKPVVR